jgi:hypothetical protein
MTGDDITPETPEAEGLAEPELHTEEVEGARLLANEARARLRGDGFSDDEIDAWAITFYTRPEGGLDEGSADDLVAFIRAEQASGRGPTA